MSDERLSEMTAAEIREKGGADYAPAMARHIKAALLHLRQAEAIAEAAGIDLDDYREGSTAHQFRQAGEYVEDLDLWAINNARGHGADPRATFAHTGSWCQAEGGSLPPGSWPVPESAPVLADPESLREVAVRVAAVGGREAGS